MEQLSNGCLTRNQSDVGNSLMTNMSEDLKRDLQEANQREKRIRIIIAITLIIILGVLTWLIL